MKSQRRRFYRVILPLSIPQALIAAIAIAAVTFLALIPSTNAATIAGAGIQLNGKYVGGYAITWDGESREDLVEQLSRHPITFERDYKIPVDAKDPNLAMIRGKIRLLSNIRGESHVMATLTKLQLAKRDGKWFVARECLQAPAALARVACEQNEDRIVVTRDGAHVLTYHKTVKLPAGVDAKFGRSGFIHPISTPSGRKLTDDYPLPHHGHQHGVFFAWKAASFEGQSLNFWEPGNDVVRHEKVLEILNEEDFAGFRVELAHVAGTRRVLRETWSVTVHSETGFIDLTSEQSCAADSAVTIERFRYGGMAVRGSRQWFKDAHTAAGKGALKDEFVESCRMITSEGLTQANGNHSRPEWVCMTGVIDAAPASITLVPHPANFRHPQQVRLHPEMPYFCFIPTVEKSFRIEPGKPLVSRFRIVAEDGEPDAAKLNAVQQAFASEE